MKQLMLWILLGVSGITYGQNPNSLLRQTGHSLAGIRDTREGVSFCLTGVYSKDEVLYYRLVAVNHSPLIYDVDALRCTIRDKKVLRRHAIQEVDMAPLWIKGDSLRIAPGERSLWLVALRKDVLPPGRYLSIALLERHGSRDLELKVGYKQLLRAKRVQ